MTITHDNEPILTGPISREEFLNILKAKIGRVDFINRNKSKNVLHPYSYLGEGYIVMQLGDFFPVLYDSVRNPTAYMSATQDWGVTVGRHNSRGDFFTVPLEWESIKEIIDKHYVGNGLPF